MIEGAHEKRGNGKALLRSEGREDRESLPAIFYFPFSIFPVG
jgi:hypothetical protein